MKMQMKRILEGMRGASGQTAAAPEGALTPDQWAFGIHDVTRELGRNIPSPDQSTNIQIRGVNTP